MNIYFILRTLHPVLFSSTILISLSISLSVCLQCYSSGVHSIISTDLISLKDFICSSIYSWLIPGISEALRSACTCSVVQGLIVPYLMVEDFLNLHQAVLLPFIIASLTTGERVQQPSEVLYVLFRNGMMTQRQKWHLYLMGGISVMWNLILHHGSYPTLTKQNVGNHVKLPHSKVVWQTTFAAPNGSLPIGIAWQLAD